MSDQTAPNTRLHRRIISWIAKGFIALLLLALLARFVLGYIAAGDMRDALQAVAQSGDPLTFDDLDALTPAAPPQQDAARYYNAAISLMLDFNEEHLLSVYVDALQTWPPTIPDKAFFDQADQALQNNRQFFNLIDQGAALPHCRFDLGIRYGFDQPLKILSRIRQAVKLNGLRTFCNAARGETESAVDSLISGLAVSRTLDLQPVLISYLVQLACQSFVWNATIDTLELVDPGDDLLARLQDAVQQADRPDAFTRSIRAERVVVVAACHKATVDNVKTPATPNHAQAADLSQQFGFWAQPILHMMLAGQLADQQRMIQAADQPFPQAYDAIKAVKTESYFGALLVPSMDRTAYLTMVNLAKLRATAIAIMLERYHLANNSYPETLEKLIPVYADRIPVDPFSGRPLLYRLEKDCYIVYCVGENRVDDQGDVVNGKASKDQGIRLRFHQ